MKSALPSKDERASRGATLIPRLGLGFSGLFAITGAPGEAYWSGSASRLRGDVPCACAGRPLSHGTDLSESRRAGTPPLPSRCGYGLLLVRF